jgi:hypothetical protein
MGKDSLLESTSNKKTGTKKGQTKPKAAAKKATPKQAAAKTKTTKATPKKAAARKASGKATAVKAKAAPQTAAKSARAKTSMNAKQQATTKKPSRKELLFKKISPLASPKPYRPPAKARKSDGEAPSFFAGLSPEQTTKAKEALRRKFDWKAIKAAGAKYAKDMAAKAEEEAKRKAAEEAKRKAEEEAKRKAAEEAKRKAEEEAKRKAEEEAKRKAEEEAKRKAEEEAKRKAEEEAKRKAEEEAKHKAAEEAKRKAEEEAKHKAAEEAKRKAEEEAKRKAAEEAKRKAEEEAKRKAAEEEAQRLAAEEARRQTEAAAAARSQNKPLKIGLAAFAVVLTLLILSSYSNTKKYYITAKDGTVEIWRGTFTPMGKTRLIAMPGSALPEPAKEVYGWADAYRLMYQHYIDKADALLDTPGVPDSIALTANLEQAIRYAPNRELRDAARARLINLRLLALVQKAQAALNRGTVESTQAALGFLHEARRFDLSEAEAEMLDRKIDAAQETLTQLQEAQTAAEKEAAAQAALEADTEDLKAASQTEAPSPAASH